MITQKQINAVRDQIRASGKSYREIAAEINTDYESIRNVLNGKSKCTRGKAHHIAVALGLKPKVEFPIINK